MDSCQRAPIQVPRSVGLLSALSLKIGLGGKCIEIFKRSSLMWKKSYNFVLLSRGPITSVSIYGRAFNRILKLKLDILKFSNTQAY